MVLLLRGWGRGRGRGRARGKLLRGEAAAVDAAVTAAVTTTIVAAFAAAAIASAAVAAAAIPAAAAAAVAAATLAAAAMATAATAAVAAATLTTVALAAALTTVAVPAVAASAAVAPLPRSILLAPHVQCRVRLSRRVPRRVVRAAAGGAGRTVPCGVRRQGRGARAVGPAHLLRREPRRSAVVLLLRGRRHRGRGLDVRGRRLPWAVAAAIAATVATTIAAAIAAAFAAAVASAVASAVATTIDPTSDCRPILCLTANVPDADLEASSCQFDQGETSAEAMRSALQLGCSAKTSRAPRAEGADWPADPAFRKMRRGLANLPGQD